MLLDKVRTDHPSAHGAHRTKNADIYEEHDYDKPLQQRNSGYLRAPRGLGTCSATRIPADSMGIRGV